MESLIKLFLRDIDKLAREIESFDNSQSMWKVLDGVNNSCGNLCLHLIGNLNHFIASVIGESGYVRQREKEFSDKDVTPDMLISMIEETKKSVKSALEKFDWSKLQSSYPIDVFGEKMTYEYFLIHLHSHLNYHLGQINYLRRIIEK